jgi:hypothetical protein
VPNIGNNANLAPVVSERRSLRGELPATADFRIEYSEGEAREEKIALRGFQAFTEVGSSGGSNYW